MTKVVLCICTYKRPDGLAKLLENLTTLSPATPDVVVVIDNHVAGDGAAVCEQIASNYPFELPHAIEAEPGMAGAKLAG